MLEDAVRIVCLVYHEARNVRHPIKSGLVAANPYKALVGLPTNRGDAWVAMEKVRRQAISTGSVASAAAVFQQRFGLSLEGLVELYRAPVWKNSAYGGNKWAPICAKVRDLVEAAESGDKVQAAELFELILEMEHNTGKVRDKLRRLSA